MYPPTDGSHRVSHGTPPCSSTTTVAIAASSRPTLLATLSTLSITLTRGDLLVRVMSAHNWQDLTYRPGSDTKMTGREALEQQKPHHYGCIHAINTQLDTLVPVARIPPELPDTLVPVARIPPELLFDIFLHTAGHRAHPKSRPPTVRSWICVTHVCRHWRETALQCTSLWSRIDVPSHP